MKASTIFKDMIASIFAGRKSKYWVRVRNMAKHRDKYKCKVCGSANRLEVHHLEDWSNNRFKRFQLSNLITLCRKCHRDYHVNFMGGFAVRTDGASFLRWKRKRKK
jgi:5-methylcytosine-specific restriction endonuclease McrA